MPFPLSPPPASDKGAFTCPRMLQRWLDVHPVSKLTRTEAFITLPSFTINSSWIGVSDIVAAFNFEGPNNFSLVGFDVEPFPAPNYMLCVMWKDKNDVTHRYKLWEGIGEVFFLDAPLYSGQKIAKNFRFEIWNNSTTPTVQSSSIKIYTSVLGGVDYRYGQDFTLVSADTVVTNFNNINTLPIVFPANGLFERFISTSGLITAGGNTFSSWTDTILGTVLTLNTSLVIVTPIGMTQNCVFSAGGTIHGTGSSLTRTLAMMVNIGDNTATQQFFNDGGNIALNYRASDHSIYAFGNGVGITVPTGIWLLVVAQVFDGGLSIYNMSTGELIGSITGALSISPSGTLVFGNMQVSTPEIALFASDLQPSTINQLVGYFISTYSPQLTFSATVFSLPLTFPANSSPLPN